MDRNSLKSSKDYGKTLENVSDKEYRILRDKYDLFLEQPLTLSMFIATDENGNVLEDITPHGLVDKYSEKSKQYQQAKSKVIFEGFEWNTAEFCDEPMIELVDKKGNYLLYDCDDKNFQNAGDEFILTIEDLIPYNLTLTDNVKI